MKKRFAYWIGGWPYVATATLLAYAAVAAAVASTAVAYSSAQQQKKIAQNTADYNSKLQQNEAAQVQMESAENAHRMAVAARQRQGSQRAAIAASGIAEAGSPLEVLAYSAGQEQLALNDMQREAEAKRTSLLSGAVQTQLGGQAMARGYQMQSYGTILSGVSSVAGTVGTAKYQGAI